MMKLFSWGKKRSKLDRAGRTIVTRGFAAAEVNRLLAGWKWDGGFNSGAVVTSLPTIRSRSREMAKNSPYFRRWIDLWVANIIGEGFTLKSTPHDGFPGDPAARLDTRAAQFIEWHLWNWANTPAVCDAQGRKTLVQIDRLCAEMWARDGEYFMLMDSTAQNKYGFSLRIIRPDACPHEYNEDSLPNGNIVRGGVEVDPETWRPVAYYFRTKPMGAYVQTHTGPMTRIDAARVIHGFSQHDETQTRGIPESYSALVKMKMLEELDIAELTAARDEACSVRTYFAPKGDEGAIADLTSSENAEAANALTADKEPGQSEVLPMGWQSQVHTPQHPNAKHGPFKVTLLRDLASGLGVEYSCFANDWSGVSYSSVRQGVIAERDLWKVRQSEFIAQNKSPVFLTWLRSFLSLEVSGQYPIAKFDKFAEHEFRGRRWMWVDPSNDMNAAQLAVDRGWRTNTDITSDLGGDYDENLETQKREREKRAETGMPEPIRDNEHVTVDEGSKTNEQKKQKADDGADGE